MGRQLFSKLDLVHMPINRFQWQKSHKDLYRYNHLPFGVVSAPSILQQTMETVTRISRVCVYLDDILVTGEDDRKYLQNLNTVLTPVEEAGLRLQHSKCSFMLPA